MRMCGGYFITDFIVVVKCRNYYPGVSDYIIHHIVALTAFLLADSGSGKYWYTTFVIKLPNYCIVYAVSHGWTAYA